MPTRILITGAGVIARAHAAAACALPDGAELHVCDPSDSARAAFLAENPAATAHPGVEAMLALPARAGDIVIVATPPLSHCDIARQALASGRHVLCEKPLTMTVDEARSLRDMARERGLHIADCSMRFLGDPAARALRDRITLGGLGRLYHVACRHIIARSRSGIEYQPESRWFLDRSLSGGGVLMDWGVYDLATLFDMLQPSSVTVRWAWMAQPETAADPVDRVFDVETHVGATLTARLQTGDEVTISYERASGTHAAEMMDLQVQGTRGAAVLKWIPWPEPFTAVTLRTDSDGAIVEEKQHFDAAAMPHVHHRPLILFNALIRNTAIPFNADPVVDEIALMNYSVVRAIYEVAAGASPITVTR